MLAGCSLDQPEHKVALLEGPFVVSKALGNDSYYLIDAQKPRSRELVLAGCSLDQPKHKVALFEGSCPDLPIVVAAQTLLVDGRPAKG